MFYSAKFLSHDRPPTSLMHPCRRRTSQSLDSDHAPTPWRPQCRRPKVSWYCTSEHRWATGVGPT